MGEDLKKEKKSRNEAKHRINSIYKILFLQTFAVFFGFVYLCAIYRHRANVFEYKI